MAGLSESLTNVLAEAARLYPRPWVVGWNEYDGVRQLEVNRRLAYARQERHRWTGATWDDVLAQLTRQAAPQEPQER